MAPVETDEGLRMLGKYSRWQLLIYFVLSIVTDLVFAWGMMSVIFIADMPDHHCHVPGNATLNETIPRVYSADGWRWSQCSMYVNLSVGNETEPCRHGYWYDPASGYQSTLVTEFNLVCERDALAETSMLLSAAGQTVGALVCNYLADHLGRKPILLACVWSNAVIAFVQAASPSFVFYAILAFINGIQLQGIVATFFVLSLELFPTEQRTFAGVCLEFLWAFGCMTLAPLAYFIRNWRYLRIAVTIPFIPTIAFYWFLPESIPWLVANGKVEKANKIMHRAAKTNRILLPNHIFTDPESVILIREKRKSSSGKERLINIKKKLCSSSESENKSKVNYGLKDIYSSPALRLYTAVNFLLWFVNALVYFGVSLTVASLEGNRYLNFFLYSLVEVPAYALCWLFLERYGRLITISAFHGLAGVTLIASVIQTFDFAQNLVPVTITLSMLGKLGITVTFAAIYVHVAEMYPTNLRNTGLGLAQFAARMASYVASFARVLARWKGWVPRVIFGVLSLLAALAVLLLPETRWRSLPETVEEIEVWRRQPKFYKPHRDTRDYDGKGHVDLRQNEELR